MGKNAELIDAICARELDQVKALASSVDLDPPDWDEPSEHPLLAACAEGCIEVLKALLDAHHDAKGFDRHYLSRDESHSLTLLAVALSNDNDALADWLVELGADVNATFHTAAGCATEFEIARFFDDDQYGRTAGICWWLARDPLLERMRGKGLNPNATTREEIPALVHAVRQGRLHRVGLLLALGANANDTVSPALAERARWQIPEGASVLMYAVFAYIDQARSEKKSGISNGLLPDRLRIIETLLATGARLGHTADNYVDGMRSATVCDWVLEYGDDALLELFGLAAMRERLTEARLNEACDLEEERKAIRNDYYAALNLPNDCQWRVFPMGRQPVAESLDTRTVLTVMPDRDHGPFLWTRHFGNEAWEKCCDALSHCNQHPMSDALWAAFSQWTLTFEQAPELKDGKLGRLDLDWSAFHADGLSLARRLKMEVDEEFRVVYLSPYEDSQGDFRCEVMSGGTTRPLPTLAEIRAAKVRLEAWPMP